MSDEQEIPIHIHTSDESSGDDMQEEAIRPVPKPKRASSPRRPKSIQNISVSSRRTAAAAPRIYRGMAIPGWVWAIIIFIVILISGAAYETSRETEVSVVPKAKAVSLEKVMISAYPESTATSSLSYTVQQFDVEQSSLVAGGKTVHSERKANGTITITNDVSTTPMKLVKGTRFESSDGHIYRIQDNVIVPPKKSSATTIQASIYADQAGDTYNIDGPMKFTIPGLKPRPQLFAGITAQSEAAISGGFVGDEPGADPKDLATARADLRTQLQQKAISSLASLQKTTLALADGMTLAYEDEPLVTGDDGKVIVRVKAHVSVPVVSDAQFADAVAALINIAPDGAPKHFAGNSDFLVSFPNRSETLGQEALTLALQGTGKVVWLVDSDAFANALAGHPVSDTQSILGGFPGVTSITEKIEPFWSSSFPAKPAQMHITVEDPQPQD